MDSFTAYLDDSRPVLSVEQRSVATARFRKHVAKFAFFRDAFDERNRLVKAFQNHMEDYLDGLLPHLAEHFNSNRGRPPKLERIEWLLRLNVEGLTVSEILNKYTYDLDKEKLIAELPQERQNQTCQRINALAIEEQSSLREALGSLKSFDLPVRSKKGKPTNR